MHDPLHRFGHPIECLGNATRDAGEGVAIAAERDGGLQGVLEADRVKEGPDGLGDNPAARHVEAVPGPDPVHVAAEVMAEAPLDKGPQLGLGRASAGGEDGRRRGLSALDALGWLWVTAVKASAWASTVSRSLKAKPTGLTRIAAPLPQLL